MNRIVISVLLAMVLASMMYPLFNIMPVEAVGTIYIRADGSIDPLTAPISTADNVTYTFAGNINDSIVVERGSIVVDGAGYMVQGTGSSVSIGINLTGRSNVTIKNMTIKGFLDGIWLGSSSNNSISGSNITANNGNGIWLEYSSDNRISGNNITNNGYGIILGSSSNNSISGKRKSAKIDIIIA